MLEAIDAYHRTDTAERRLARARAQILSMAQTRLRSHPDLERLAQAVAEGRDDPYGASDRLFVGPAEA